MQKKQNGEEVLARSVAPEYLRNTFDGRALKALRNRRGWSQQKLATTAKVPAPSISDYENNQYPPTVATLAKVLNALESDLGELWDAILELRGDKVEVVKGANISVLGTNSEQVETLLGVIKILSGGRSIYTNGN